MEKRLLDEALGPGAVALDARLWAHDETAGLPRPDRPSRRRGQRRGRGSREPVRSTSSWLADLHRPGLPFAERLRSISCTRTSSSSTFETRAAPSPTGIASCGRAVGSSCSRANRASPLMAVSDRLPDSVRLAIKRRGAGAAERDVYPTRYLANTPGRLAATASSTGFAAGSGRLRRRRCTGTARGAGRRRAPARRTNAPCPPAAARRSSRATGRRPSSLLLLDLRDGDVDHRPERGAGRLELASERRRRAGRRARVADVRVDVRVDVERGRDRPREAVRAVGLRLRDPERLPRVDALLRPPRKRTFTPARGLPASVTLPLSVSLSWPCSAPT